MTFLHVKDNPLDELLSRLGGPASVAEMTGRRARVVVEGDSRRLEPRNAFLGDATLDTVNICERDHFLQGRKLVAIISGTPLYLINVTSPNSGCP